ncbi:hypothetical protein C5167_005593 [Papaver somniferum]|uniref:Uncharacterized protein n=1 Tax=Papaver somniferum TaxID=3469 RepID=A0A4Y7JES9_PAPSO|nr:hypothetical protein C5167_005593 [Papaver somniferum]
MQLTKFRVTNTDSFEFTGQPYVAGNPEGELFKAVEGRSLFRTLNFFSPLCDSQEKRKTNAFFRAV